MKFILLANHDFRGDIPSSVDEAAHEFEKVIRRRKTVQLETFTFLGYESLGGAMTVQKRSRSIRFCWYGSNYCALKRALGSKDGHVFVEEGTLDFRLLRQTLIPTRNKVTQFPSSATSKQIVGIMSKFLI